MFMRYITNKWFHICLLLLFLAVAVYFSGSHHEFRKRLQYTTFDTYNQLYPRDPTNEIVILDLDEESIKLLGQWPWPRHIMASIVDNLKSMGAKSIAFDVVFSEPDRTSPRRIMHDLPDDLDESVKETLSTLPDNDDVFATAIKNAGNVVTGFSRARPEESLRKPALIARPTLLLKNKEMLYENTFSAPGVVTNLPEFSGNAAGNGSFMATPDIDGIIRQVSLFNVYPAWHIEDEQSQLYPMLALEALRVSINPKGRFLVRQKKDKDTFDANYLIKMGNIEVPIENDSKLWVYYRDIKPEEYISAHLVLDQSKHEELQNKIKDKIVFVGTSAEGLRDIRSTPLDIFIPGVEVHVNVVEQILQGKYLKRPDIIIGVEAAIIAAVGFLIIILAPFINVVFLGLFTLTLMGTLFFGSVQAYVQQGLLIDPVYPSAVLFFLFLMSSLLSYLRSEMDRRQVRDAFGYYISPAFMEELAKNPEKLALGGEVKDLTVMFTDIRSFTKISESLTPEELIQLMNDFLTPMSDLSHGKSGND